jgi:branched-chain amino acid transport system substrate-binding protein
LLAAAIKQANSTDGPKILAALNNLNAPVEGVITTYVKPYTPTDHEAIKAKNVVMGVVENGRIEYLNAEDAAGPNPANAGTAKKK